MYSVARLEATHYRCGAPLKSAKGSVSVVGGQVRGTGHAIWSHVIRITSESATPAYCSLISMEYWQMTSPSRNRKVVILIAAVLSCAVIALFLGIAFPTPVANTALGADWQCHRSAGIVTTCQRLSHAAPSHYRSLIQPVALRRV